jgi:RsiW-degrading membrane proteinase PrsW (M82 family)
MKIIFGLFVIWFMSGFLIRFFRPDYREYKHRHDFNRWGILDESAMRDKKKQERIDLLVWIFLVGFLVWMVFQH